MAHTKAGGSTKLGRDSRSKRLGVKIHDGGTVTVGQIIVRQRGTKYHPGANVKQAGDDTLYAMKDGVVHFRTRQKRNFDRSMKTITVVGVA